MQAQTPLINNRAAGGDRNWSLAGQKWELGRTEMEAWQDRRGKLGIQKSTFCQCFSNFCQLNATFCWFSPYFPIFSSIFACFSAFIYHICLLAEQFGRVAWHIAAWQNKIGELGPPESIFFGRTGLSFGRKKLLAPPKKCPKNAYAHWAAFR